MMVPTQTEPSLQPQPLNPVLAASLVLHGIVHYIFHPNLWIYMLATLGITWLSSILSFSALLRYALVPQARLLMFTFDWPAWAAWATAIFAIVAEVSVINTIVFLLFFSCVQSHIFLAVLEDRGTLDAIRAELGTEELPELSCCKDTRHGILFLLARIPLMILTLPLHAFPVAGQVAWVALNGWLYTWELEAEFLVMMDSLYSCKKQWQYVKQNWRCFGSFGAAAMALELVPILGPAIFFASNACGAAFLAEYLLLGRGERQKASNIIADETECADLSFQAMS